MNGQEKLFIIALVVSIFVIIGLAIVFSFLFFLYSFYKVNHINVGLEDKSLKKEYCNRIYKINVNKRKRNKSFISCEEMIKNGYNLGGEENGHIILGDVGAESCGLSTALMLLKVLIDEGESVEKLLVGLERTDVVTSDIPVSDRQKALVSSGVLEEYVQALEEELGLNGRIILRASGTEDVVRVLVEGRDHEKLLSLCTQLQNRVVAL